MEIDEKVYALMVARAAERGFPDVEAYVRALLERDLDLDATSEAKARHVAMRGLLDAGKGDHSAN